MFNFFKSPATHADMIKQWQTITSECLFQVARDQMFNSSTCSASYLVQVSSRTRGHDQAVARPRPRRQESSGNVKIETKMQIKIDFQTRVTILAETYIPASRASSWRYAP